MGITQIQYKNVSVPSKKLIVQKSGSSNLLQENNKIDGYIYNRCVYINIKGSIADEKNFC